MAASPKAQPEGRAWAAVAGPGKPWCQNELRGTAVSMHGRHYSADDASQNWYFSVLIVLHVLPRVSERCLIIECAEFDAILYMTIGTKNVRSILLHDPPPCVGNW